MSDSISVISLILSLVAVVLSLRANRRQEVAATMLGHLSPIVELESRLGVLPNALRFHGVGEEEIREAGLEPQEFAYLVNSFTLGSVWHQIITPKIKTEYGIDEYRTRMCRSKEFRRAWPVVKKLLNPTDFVDLIDATVKTFERKEYSEIQDGHGTANPGPQPDGTAGAAPRG